MTKYYLQGTAEELKFGDMLVLDLAKDFPDGSVRHRHMEVKFLPSLVPLLMEQGIVEEREVKDTSSIGKDIECLRKKIQEVTDRANTLTEMLDNLLYIVTYSPEPQQDNSTKRCRRARKTGRKQKD